MQTKQLVFFLAFGVSTLVAFSLANMFDYFCFYDITSRYYVLVIIIIFIVLTFSRNMYFKLAESKK